VSAPNDAVWYISRDGQQFGPFSADDFAGFLERRQLRPTDQVWQAGMDAWIAYSDYEARKTAARFVEPHGPSSSTKTDLVRGRLRVSTKILTAAFQGMAKYATTRAMADRTATSIRPTARHGSSGAIADNSTQDQHGSMPDLKIKDVVETLRSSPSTARLEDQHGSMSDLKMKDVVEPLRRSPRPRLEDQHGSMPERKIKDVVEPLDRLPSIPRLASEGEAAAI